MSEMKSPDPQQQKLTLTDAPDYRDTYANSVQVKMSVWDFMLVFGTLQPTSSQDEVSIRNLQGIYLSPQQAKALWNVLGQNLAQYEQTFGEVHLEPQFNAPNGPVH
jgi:hypothetical protein